LRDSPPRLAQDAQREAILSAVMRLVYKAKLGIVVPQGLVVLRE
jgi:hypothetical protein